jgi:hypothetical protein
LLVSPDTFGRRLSAGVGTVTYSSPEQLHGSAYDLKVLPLWQIEKGRPRSCSIVLQQLHFLQSDMFSLGIVMYELLSPFATEMERAVCLSGLRSGRICPEFSMRYPAHARIIGKSCPLTFSSTKTRLVSAKRKGHGVNVLILRLSADHPDFVVAIIPTTNRTQHTASSISGKKLSWSDRVMRTGECTVWMYLESGISIFNFVIGSSFPEVFA